MNLIRDLQRGANLSLVSCLLSLTDRVGEGGVGVELLLVEVVGDFAVDDGLEFGRGVVLEVGDVEICHGFRRGNLLDVQMGIVFPGAEFGEFVEDVRLEVRTEGIDDVAVAGIVVEAEFFRVENADDKQRVNFLFFHSVV